MHAVGTLQHLAELLVLVLDKSMVHSLVLLGKLQKLALNIGLGMGRVGRLVFKAAHASVIFTQRFVIRSAFLQAGTLIIMVEMDSYTMLEPQL